MTILEKLNLEPASKAIRGSREHLLTQLVPFNPNNPASSEKKYGALCNFSDLQPYTLTNAEFLTACEEWLKSN